jgi:urease alpha subunit
MNLWVEIEKDYTIYGDECKFGGGKSLREGQGQNMVVGSSTEVIAGEGEIVTAGGIDVHVHYICPQIAQEVSLLRDRGVTDSRRWHQVSRQ